MPVSSPADVLVAGLGPAGRAVAARAARAGLDVIAVDPQPSRRWTATYGAWRDELPPWLPEQVTAVEVAAPAVWASGLHELTRPYRILDTARLQDCLDLDGVSVVRGMVDTIDAHSAVLSTGDRVLARYMIDARGVPAGPDRAAQTAFGRVFDDATAASALEGQQAWFMDWRRDNGTDSSDVPSFLYAMPLGGGLTLLEETCLVGRPPLTLPELQRRLDIRLAARGVAAGDSGRIEKVRFAVEGIRSEAGVVGFGARGGLMHPATGYAVATALSTADALVDAVLAGSDPQRVLWPVSARGVGALRALGLRVLLRLDAQSAAAFFDVFFDLPTEQQRAYLSGREDLAAVAGTMWTLFRRLPGPLRGAILRSVW
ncbi:lycopene cyclase family protein [Rhodococcus sp. NPDC058639]|uniref:lycopene cyclase family protein n=1 Tax=Rhodococcus sp. NPDC058639 TaxID=3346570 RepID=UPI00364AF2C3